MLRRIYHNNSSKTNDSIKCCPSDYVNVLHMYKAVQAFCIIICHLVMRKLTCDG